MKIFTESSQQFRTFFFSFPRPRPMVCHVVVYQKCLSTAPIPPSLYLVPLLHRPATISHSSDTSSPQCLMHLQLNHRHDYLQVLQQSQFTQARRIWRQHCSGGRTWGNLRARERETESPVSTLDKGEDNENDRDWLSTCEVLTQACSSTGLCQMLI